jgi:hypothetical protein
MTGTAMAEGVDGGGFLTLVVPSRCPSLGVEG